MHGEYPGSHLDLLCDASQSIMNGSSAGCLPRDLMSFSALRMFVLAVLDSWLTESSGPKLGSRNSVLGGHGIGCGNVNDELPPGKYRV